MKAHVMQENINLSLTPSKRSQSMLFNAMNLFWFVPTRQQVKRPLPSTRLPHACEVEVESFIPHQ